jgi:hypothetical protein
MSYETCSYAWHMKQGELGTCYDGFKNGDETGIDCGGSCPDCVINGGWSDFGDWDECSAPCGNGVVTAIRLCNNPAPQNGGRYCVGEPTITKRCSNGPCEVEYGDRCEYTTNVHHFDVLVTKGESQTLTKIPKEKSNIMIKMKSNADIDICLETRKGEKLISYSGPNTNWGASSFTFDGMKIKGCTDGCDENIEVVYNGDGLDHGMVADAAYNSEYIYIDRSRDAMLLKVAGYEDGKGVVSYEYDCPEDCEVCIPNTEMENPSKYYEEIYGAGAAAETATEG